MNYPILYSSTHHLSKDELKNYIINFQDHKLNFTLLDNGVRFTSYHKYNDNLYIRLEWLIDVEMRNNFSIPTDLSNLFLLEEEKQIYFKRGNIVHYSKEMLTTMPNDETYNIFYSKIRAQRSPIQKNEHYKLEFPKYTEEPKIEDEQINEVIYYHNLFQEYLEKRDNNKNKTPKKKTSQ